jgi:hypothetical protein
MRWQIPGKLDRESNVSCKPVQMLLAHWVSSPAPFWVDFPSFMRLE